MSGTRHDSSNKLAFALGVAYAATDEIHQHFVSGRHGAPVDVAIDAVGVLVGVLACRRVLSRAAG